MQRLLSLSLACLVGCSAFSWAGGAAHSGIATTITNAQIAANNPSGMAFLPEGIHKSVGGIVAVGFGEFEIDENITSVDGGDPDNDIEPVIIPSAFYVRSINEDWRWGISLYVPSGFGSSNGSDWAGRYYSDDFSLVWVSLTPAVSYRINDQWSVGASINATYNYSESIARVRNLEPGSSDGKLEYEADAVGFNGSLSVMYQPTEGTRFGLVYSNEATADLEGDVKFKQIGPLLENVLERAGLGTKFDLEVENKMPARVLFGAHHTLDNGHYFTIDTAWVEFSEFGTGDITLEGDKLESPEGIYDDIWFFAAGYNIPLDARRTLKFGMLHISEPVDDDDRVLALRLDEVWGVGAGMSYKLENADLDLNINFLRIGDAPVDTGDSTLRGRVVGESDTPYVVVIDVAYHF